MLKLVEEINRLIESGNIEKAFDRIIDLDSVNKSFSKELKTLKARYSILSKNLNKGTLEFGNNSELNKILNSFFNLLQEIEDDFINNNSWIQKEKRFLENELLVWLKESIIDEFANSKLNFYINEHISVGDLQSKIDKDYWYIIHWRATMKLDHLEIIIRPKEESAKKEKEKGPLNKSGIGFIYQIENKVKEILLSLINECGSPIFNIKVQDFVAGDAKIGFYIQFTSTIYPSQEEKDNYPWKKAM